MDLKTCPVGRCLVDRLSCCFHLQNADDGEHPPIPVLYPANDVKPKKSRIKMEVIILLQGKPFRIDLHVLLLITWFCCCGKVPEVQENRLSSNRCALFTGPVILKRTNEILSKSSIKTYSWLCRAWFRLRTKCTSLTENRLTRWHYKLLIIIVIIVKSIFDFFQIEKCWTSGVNWLQNGHNLWKSLCRSHMGFVAGCRYSTVLWPETWIPTLRFC